MTVVGFGDQRRGGLFQIPAVTATSIFDPAQGVLALKIRGRPLSGCSNISRHVRDRS
ncbi:protein of unknown function [Methylorubrum extorquens]|uniref:Uncharacterized protein n=1 Tax=Methylorubrum extorquens TaxID=408 RepID=A0A2N9AXY0_METEX|nr:protein of unknown function [Methylorubrum extorquens]